MKTPEEIKKELEAPIGIHYHDDPEPRLTPRVLAELRWLHDDALAHIQQQERIINTLAETNASVYKKRDSLAERIRQLEANNSQVKKALRDNGFRTLAALISAYHQVKAERDAAVECLKEAARTSGDCSYCSHIAEHEKDCIENDCECGKCTISCPCKNCKEASNWEFAGGKKG